MAAPAERAFAATGAFEREPLPGRELPHGVLLDEPAFRVRAAFLDHRTACLGFAVEEKIHINVWKNRLAELGLPVGPWLKELKDAVRQRRGRRHAGSRPLARPRWRARAGAAAGHAQG